MKNHRLSIPDDDEHRVLQFRPRPPAPGAASTARVMPPVQNDLSRYERPRDPQQDDFRQRMLTNLAALAFTVALTVIGFWLATSIADLRKTQDCVLMGRRDCAHIPAPQG
ncbi:conserved hypothetical protein [Rhodopseudomonas palustris HaA2]|uniref:Uncharacterized protein n=1 Tax=Rhodopseudomonas palustris (strain HaA2) TaxID=316058 RepID=Q2IUR2_RHOP2|nr:hypothetical protein [Rhodopseudomonas palustris]ABD08048.1 conserved hypothetical protein [Rhodopseudomonas palustris HaA2]